MSIKRNEANKSICKSTLEHVVEDVMEGVKELDIADSTQVNLLKLHIGEFGAFFSPRAETNFI